MFLLYLSTAYVRCRRALGAHVLVAARRAVLTSVHGSRAAERARLAKRRTIQHDDVFQAVQDLDHDGIEEGVADAFAGTCRRPLCVLLPTPV